MNGNPGDDGTSFCQALLSHCFSGLLCTVNTTINGKFNAPDQYWITLIIGGVTKINATSGYQNKTISVSSESFSALFWRKVFCIYN